MKHLSPRVLFLCVFLPPVLYIYTIQGLEMFLQHTWGSELQGRIITKPQELLSGRKTISQEIRGNVNDYLKSLWLVRLGPEPLVLVKTRSGRVIYPLPEGEGQSAFDYSEGILSSPGSSGLSRVAERNVQILQEGLSFSLAVKIPRNTWLANLVLLFYVLLSVTVLCLSYRSRTREFEKMTRQKEQDLEEARERLVQAQSRLRDTTDREQAYRRKVDLQQEELVQADQRLQSTEEEALAEMEALENKLQESITEKQEQEEEIELLLREVERLKSASRISGKKKDKQHDNIRKRFSVLYKNIEFHDRALEGFLQLPKDLALKSEEMIQILNQDCSLVKVKRKVFSGKGCDLPVLESIFAYRGRIYWRKTGGARVEVMAVGTKNTQDKDLSYLEGLG